MRIAGLSNVPAEIKTNIAALKNRLNTGDMIKAKVLEISSEEIILRLSDGSILNASINESLTVKAGQTLALRVTSKAEGTLYLEIVKDKAQNDILKPDILKNLLDSFQLKPDAQNMELASEIMKAGVPATAGILKNASRVMKNLKGIDAEKAVFIASKELFSSQTKADFLLKLLDGNFKIGDQLNELQILLKQINSKIESNSSNSTFNQVMKNLPGDTQNAPVQDTASSSASAAGVVDPAKKTSVDTIFSSTASMAQESKDMKSVSLEPLKEGILSKAAADTTSASSYEKSANMVNKFNITQEAYDDVKTFQSGKGVYINKNSFSGSIPENSDRIINAELDTSLLLNKEADEKTVDRQNSFTANYKPAYFSEFKEEIEKLFIEINSKSLSEELDPNKFHKEIAGKLDMLKNTIQNTDIVDLNRMEAVSVSVAQIEDTLKLLNQLNTTMQYYQLPVNLSGSNTTAEIYVMKRKHDKKKPDPRNIVLFVSLDTVNIGRIESLIDIKGNNVILNLRIENNDIQSFVKENIKYLYKGMTDCGYKLADVKYAIIDEAATPVKLEKLLLEIANSDYGKLDMRV